jgi:hypothetical protein
MVANTINNHGASPGPRAFPRADPYHLPKLSNACAERGAVPCRAAPPGRAAMAELAPVTVRPGVASLLSLLH